MVEGNLLDPLSRLERAGGPLGVRHLCGARVQVSSECLGLNDHCGIFAALDVALVGVLESRADDDDFVGPQHLELEVGVVWDGYELRVA
jgi:hypothetical protein